MQRWLLQTTRNNVRNAGNLARHQRSCQRIVPRPLGCRQLHPASRPFTSLFQPYSPFFHTPFRIRHISSNNESYNKHDPPLETAASTETVATFDNGNDYEDDDGLDDEELDTDELVESTSRETKLVYREVLNNWYRANFDVSLNDAFETAPAPPSENGSSEENLWASTFVCPITNHRIEALYLPGVKYMSYFPTKKMANQAAALQAVNFFCPREDSPEDAVDKGGILSRKRLQLLYMKEHKIVLPEESFETIKSNRTGKKNGGTWWTASFHCPIKGETFPAMKLASRKHSSFDDGRVWYRRKGDAIQAACEQALWAVQAGTAGLSPDEYNDIYSAAPSMEPLRMWYREYDDIEITDDNFITSTGSWKGSGGNLWTSSFICPVKVTRYDSGTLPTLNPTESDGNIRWYKKKNDAMVAAALRAYDALVFESMGRNNPRFCVEDPAKDAETRTTSTADPHEPLNIQNQPDVMPQEGIKVDHEGENGNNRDDMSIIQPEIKSKQDQEDEDTDDFIIDFVPRSVEQAVDDNNITTDLGLSSQNWVHTSQEDDLLHNDRHPVLALTTSMQRRKDAIGRAYKWLAQQERGKDEGDNDTDRSRFDLIGLSRTINAAKTVLQSLALANRTEPTSNQPRGIEDAARAILDFLWSSPTTIPDADCFAFYIQCIEGNSVMVPKKAAKVYNAMACGSTFEGHSLPAPNVSVFNSLVQRKAEYGIQTSLSELSSIDTNRETFLSCLSAVAHATGQGKFGFDSHYVLDCIEALKQEKLRRNDQAFELGIDIYNAPMRWSTSTAEFAVARPYTCRIAWDSFADRAQSSHGYTKAASDQDPAIREAHAIENWFQSINSHGFGPGMRPNVETYESVVQAWLRTGSQEGLERAESSLELLRSKESAELSIRSQSVHPLILALAYSGDSAKVDKWAAILKEECDGGNDGRVMAARVLARFCADTIQANESRGSNCFRLLKEAVDEARMDGVLVESDVFALTIQAFSRQESENRSDQSSQDAIEGIQATVELFDELLASFLDPKRGTESVIQQLHLIRHAPEVYCSAFRALSGVQTAEGDALLHCLGWMEKILRRSEEHRLLYEQHKPQKSAVGLVDGDFLYKDEFFYTLNNSLGNIDDPKWDDFHKLVIDAVSELYPRHPNRSNELLRLLVLSTKASKQESSSSLDGDLLLLFNDNLARHIRKEFGIDPSKPFGRVTDSTTGNSGRSDDGLSFNARRTHERRRRKREEKKSNRPSRRPRKISSEQLQASSSA